MSISNRVVVEVPCKINLSLDITGLSGNGYHLLDSVMHAADLSDILYITTCSGGDVQVSCFPGRLPQGEANIAHRAAAAFFAAAGIPRQGVRIVLEKSIPSEAGLAGGSADAAGVLWGLNHLFGSNLSPERLREVGLTVGADVPFCIQGGCALAQGIGERLSPLPALREGCFVIAKPQAGMNTHYAFQMYDRRAGALKMRVDTRTIVEAVKAGDLPMVGAGMANVFEEACKVEEVAQIKDVMLETDALGAVMSGSGTAVAGLFDRESAARGCLELLRTQYPQTYLANPVGHGAKILLSD